MSVIGLRPDPLEEVVELLQALAAAVRLAVITELCSGPRCVHELVDALIDSGRCVRQPLMSQHLRVLRSAGVVVTERRGQEVVYRLAHSGIGDLAAAAVRQAATR
jgi:ArsR family transcriptional regulator, zinc-responsive transcriptional repressor